MRIFLIILVVAFLMSPFLLFAQPCPVPPCPPDDPGPPVPFEGLGILVAMGVWLGIRKLKGTKKEEN